MRIFLFFMHSHLPKSTEYIHFKKKKGRSRKKKFPHYTRHLLSTTYIISKKKLSVYKPLLSCVDVITDWLKLLLSHIVIKSIVHFSLHEVIFITYFFPHLSTGSTTLFIYLVSNLINT